MPEVLRPGGDAGLFLMIGLVFVAVLLSLRSLWLISHPHQGPDAKTIARRLQALAASRDRTSPTRLLKQRLLSELPVVERFFLGIPRLLQLDRLIFQAGLAWTVSRLLLSCTALGAAGYLGATVLAHQAAFIAAAGGLALATLPLLYVLHKRSRRLAVIQRQLPDALDLLARALRSGHAFSSGLQMIGEEMPAPIAQEFRIVSDEVNFGVSLQQALTNLSERLPIADLRYFVVAVLIQRDSGGNLTEVLGNLSRLIRERLKLFAKIRVLSSEGRLSAWVLGLMPFVLAALMNLVNPGFMSPLWHDPIGIAIVKYMLILMAIGILILRRIIRIHV